LCRREADYRAANREAFVQPGKTAPFAVAKSQNLATDISPAHGNQHMKCHKAFFWL
jgi:hypothetical protein